MLTLVAATRGALVAILVVSVVWPAANVHVSGWSATASPGSGLRIVGPRGETTPVVNEGGKLALKVVNASGNAVTVRRWRTDNNAIARATRRGILSGRAYGFATITAETAGGPVSGFVVVARVGSRRGASARGDTKADTSGNVYLSSPSRHAIFRASGLSAGVFAGALDQRGYADGTGAQARFDAPAGLGVDNRAGGGLFVADTANHCIRKIDFGGRTSLAVGAPRVAGTMHEDETPMAAAVMNAPRGVATVGSSMFVTDTENHCVWYVDVPRQRVQLLAGAPGDPGLANGVGREARFDRPSGIAVNSRGNLLAIADSGNNVIRLIGLVPRANRQGLVGEVTTLGLGSSARGAHIAERLGDDRGDDTITFDGPKSVSFDGVDNVYVIDNLAASVVTRGQDFVERVDLAQVGTLGAPASVTVRRTQAFVLDELAADEADAVRVVEVGPPTIANVTPASEGLAGSPPGSTVTITGTNFAKESRLTLGDTELDASAYSIESSTLIRFRVPAQAAPGGRTLTVATRGGVAQIRFDIVAASLDEIGTGDITTYYGGIPYLGDGGEALTARVELPTAICSDGAGNLFVTEPEQYRIRRIDASTKIITTAVGTGVEGFSGDGGLAIAATIGRVEHIAADASGNLFLSDTDNNRIRRVDAATGIISTVAGSDDFGSDGDGGPIGSAGLAGPTALACDARGNLFFCDNGAKIRRADAATEIVSTIAGQDGVVGETGDGGPAVQATLGGSLGLTLDPQGNLFLATVSSANGTPGYRIRRIDAETHVITAFAGTGIPGYTGDGGPAVAATMRQPQGMACDSAGNVYVAEYLNHVVRRIDVATGTIDTVAGTGQIGTGADGVPARECALSSPSGVVVDGAGAIVIATQDDLIRAVDPDGQRIDAIAGRVADSIDDGELLRDASLYASGIAFNLDGSLYVTDRLHHRVVRVAATTGRVSTVVGGTRRPGSGGDGGPAIGAELNFPGALAVALNGDLYIADRSNYRIRRVSAADETIATVAGNGTSGDTGDRGPATAASFRLIHDLELDSSGNLYLSDGFSNRVRRVDAATGEITRFAGTGILGYFGDGLPATSAKLSRPFGIDLDSAGSLFIADSANFAIRKVSAANGVITTILESAGFATDVAVDAAGNIFVATGSSGRYYVRRIDAVSRAVTTIAGSGAVGYSGDGGPGPQARLAYVSKLAIDRDGNLYLLGAFEIRVLKGVAIPVTW